MDEARALIGEMTDLLEAEREVLRAGRFEALAGPAIRKEVHLRRLAALGSQIDRASLLRLGEQARRNVALFEAALAGLRAAQARLDGIRAAASTLTTYDRHGAARNVSTATARHERRA